MRTLEDILAERSSRHKHLCPRQVLVARMSLYAAEILQLDFPQTEYKSNLRNLRRGNH
jgi:formylmethanofuran dehydrogenase subunit E